MTAAGLRDKLKGISVSEIAINALDTTKDSMVELNKEQMAQGQDSLNSRIEYLNGSHYPYTPGYAKKKAAMGLQTSVVDLRVTGNFWNSIRAIVKDSEIQFTSNIELGKYLQQNYGIKILGVTDENKAIYTRDVFFEEFKKEFTEQTGLGFS